MSEDLDDDLLDQLDNSKDGKAVRRRSSKGNHFHSNYRRIFLPLNSLFRPCQPAIIAENPSVNANQALTQANHAGIASSWDLVSTRCIVA